jgi:hypothetical protein
LAEENVDWFNDLLTYPLHVDDKITEDVFLVGRAMLIAHRLPRHVDSMGEHVFITWRDNNIPCPIVPALSVVIASFPLFNHLE